MKILILSVKMPFPPKDGGAIATLNIASGLAAAGNEITLLTFNTRKHFFPENQMHQTLDQPIRFFLVEHDTSLRFFKALINLIFSSKPYNAVRFNSNSFRKKLREILIREEFDVIQMEGPYPAWYIPLIKSYSSAKISLRAHNIESEIWERKIVHERNYLKKLYFSILANRIRNFEQDAMAHVDMLVPISDSVEKELLSYHSGIPSRVIPAGFEADSYYPAETKLPVSLFYIGSLDWMPNQEAIVWFLDNVWKNNTFNTCLHVAGRNAPAHLRKRLQNTSGIKFYGEVDDAIEFMRAHDVLISPLLSGSGLRIKILEAMLLGKIVIASPLSAEGLPCTDGENIVLAQNESMFKNKIQDLLDKPEHFVDIGLNARRLILEKFNNFVLCDQLTGFYSDNLK